MIFFFEKFSKFFRKWTQKKIDSESSETYAEPFFKVCPKVGGGPIGGFKDFTRCQTCYAKFFVR